MPLEPKMAPPGGHMFNIGLYSEKHEKIFSTETIRPRVLIFGKWHHLVDLYQICSNYALGARPGCRIFYIGLYMWKTLSETIGIGP